MINDDELDARLSALEGRVPVDAAPPALAGGRARRRRALSFVTAPVLVLAVAATALAGVGVVQLITTSSAQLEQGPLAGSELACMTPAQAAEWLSAHGYDDVWWTTGTDHGSVSADAIPVTPESTAPATAPEPAPETRAVPSTGRVLLTWYDKGTVHVIVDPAPVAGTCQ